MILQNSFYHIGHLASEDQKIEAVINFNPSHIIFDGHFPEQPVVPGVCMIQIIKELLQNQFDKLLHLQQSSQIKFLQLMVPQVHEDVNVSIHFTNTETGIMVNATFIKAGAATFKMMGTFIAKN
jgi:3-hydroxyacyl-[acyl-carrier-protein] dehydratase